jgi:hypothetical protein
MTEIILPRVGTGGIVVDTPRSPLEQQQTNLFYGFNPAMVSSCIRDTLRFLFSTAAPDRLKYSSDPKESALAIDLSFDVHTDSENQKRPKIIINRGPYQAGSVGMDDSSTGSGMVTGISGSGMSRKSSYMNLVNGTCSIRIVAWNLGVCEEIAYLVATFLTWSKPHICNTLGFKNIASPVSSSPVLLDKDDRDKFIVEISVPYSTEMRWSDTEIGVKLKGFLIELVNVNEDNQ